MTSRVTVYEVGPRDGLQNEAVTVPTADKLALIRALGDDGLRRIEATSFVSPRWIPQLADAADVTEAGARTLRCVATFSSNNPAGAAQIREIGILASSNVTTGLVARKDLTGAQSVNKGASDSIQVSYDIVFTTA